MEWPDEVSVEADGVTYATEKTLLVQLEDRQLWVPRSQISDNSEVFSASDSGTLIISAWFAEKAGLD